MKQGDDMEVARRRFQLDDSAAYALTDILEEDLSFGLQVHQSVSDQVKPSYFTFRKLVSVLLSTDVKVRVDGAKWNLETMMSADKSAKLDVFTFLGFEKRDDMQLLSILLDCMQFLSVDDASGGGATPLLAHVREMYLNTDESAEPQRANVEWFLSHAIDALQVGSRAFRDATFLRGDSRFFELCRLGGHMRKAALFNAGRGRIDTAEVIISLWEKFIELQEQRHKKLMLLSPSELCERMESLSLEQQESILACFRAPLVKLWICHDFITHRLQSRTASIPAKFVKAPEAGDESFLDFLEWALRDVEPLDQHNQRLLSLYSEQLLDLVLVGEVSMSPERDAEELGRLAASKFLERSGLEPLKRLQWTARINEMMALAAAERSSYMQIS